MMRRHITLTVTAILLLFAAACNRQGGSFTIEGVLTNHEFDHATVYLYANESKTAMDSAVIVDGKFQFKGRVERQMMGTLASTVEKANMKCTCVLVLEPGKIYINMETDSVSGTPLNDKYYHTYIADDTSKALLNQIDYTIESYYAAVSEEDAKDKADSIMKQYDLLSDSYMEHIKRVVNKSYRENGDNILGAHALHQLVKIDSLSYDSLNTILSQAVPIVAEYEPLHEDLTRLFHLDNTAEGKPYVDFEGIDFATGKATKLSKMIDTNYITIIDFWASWCSPCRQEIADNLVRLYAEYHDKGLNIIGVDVWDKSADHRAMVEKMGIEYPQLVDTVGVATETYSISGVPTIMIIDKQGTIVKRNVRGEAIEAAVVELLAPAEESNK